MSSLTFDLPLNTLTCNNCQRANTTLMICSGCNVTTYCNENCQKNHFNTHIKDCQQIGALLGDLDPIILWTISKYLDRADMTNFRLVEKELTRKLGDTWISAVNWSFDISAESLSEIPENYRLNMRKLRLSGICKREHIYSITWYFPELQNLKIENYQDSPTFLTKVKSLTHLRFGNQDFNEPVDGLLPNSLVHLDLNYSYNHPLTNLPQNLEFLMVEEGFRQSLDFIPNSITDLRMGNEINDEMQCTITKLPLNINVLNVYMYARVGVGQFEGMNLLMYTNLTIIRAFEIVFNPNMLPQNLKIFYGRLSGHVIENLPDSIIDMESELSSDYVEIKQLPSSLQRLMLWQRDYTTLQFNIKKFPSNLQTLEFGNYIYNINYMPELPETLLSLDLTGLIVDEYGLPIPLIFPNSIEKLKLPDWFKQRIYKLPDRIKLLQFNNENINHIFGNDIGYLKQYRKLEKDGTIRIKFNRGSIGEAIFTAHF